MSETDFLDQDIQTPATDPIIESSEQNPADLPFEAPSWDDVRDGKVTYKELPSSIKAKVKHEAYEETPDDKKYLWDDYGYTPPETYNGVDRNGKPVQGFGLDGFEDLVKKGRIQKKTKIEQDVENLTHLVKEQTKSNLSQQESDIEKKISEAKENFDFDTYEKLRDNRETIRLQKLQLDTPKPKIEAAPVNTHEQYSLEEQAAVEIFRNNPDNQSFIDIMGKNQEMRVEFDNTASYLKSRNPNAPLDQIAAATKTIVENKFNLNKQQKPMFRNTIRTEEKTNLNSKPTQRLSYAALGERDKKWVNSEARSGKNKYAGKSMDDIANMIYGHLLKK